MQQRGGEAGAGLDHAAGDGGPCSCYRVENFRGVGGGSAGGDASGDQNSAVLEDDGDMAAARGAHGRGKREGAVGAEQLRSPRRTIRIAASGDQDAAVL